MPSYMCVVCKISSKFVKRRNLAISFHGFPSQPVRKQAWEDFCGVSSGVVCSEHFADNCFLSGRDEPDKRRRLIARAVPTIRNPATEHRTSNLTTNSSEENNSDMEDMDMSEVDTISSQLDTISQLRGQVNDYRTQLEETTKKVHEMEEAILERDCIIDELQKELDDVTQKLHAEKPPVKLPDLIKTKIID